MRRGICHLCDTPRRWNVGVKFCRRAMWVGAEWGDMPGFAWHLRIGFLGLQLHVWWGCP